MRRDTSYTTLDRSPINNISMNSTLSVFEPLTDGKIIQAVEEQVSLRLSRVIQIGQLQIIKRQTRKPVQKYVFILSKDCMYYSCSFPVIVDRNYEFKSKARMNITWLRTRFYTINESLSGTENCYIEIIRKNKSVTLMCDKLNEYNAWVTNLCAYTIQTNFFNKFSVNSMLHKGEKSTIYKITNKYSSKKFACKKLKKMVLNQPGGFEALVGEIKTLQTLRGNPVVPVLEEIHETENSVYIVMELVEGGYALNSRSIPNLASISNLAKQLLAALTIFEKHAIEYGNLIEDNILVVHKNRPLRNNSIKLVGFSKAIVGGRGLNGLANFSNSGNSLNPDTITLKNFDFKLSKDIGMLAKLLFRTIINIHDLTYSECRTVENASAMEMDLSAPAFKMAPLGCKFISAESYPVYCPRARKQASCK